MAMTKDIRFSFLQKGMASLEPACPRPAQPLLPPSKTTPPAHSLYSSSDVNSMQGIWHCTRIVSKAFGPLKMGSTNIGLRIW